jgi:uncharacterized protein YdaU (DUF1376 family)
MADFPALPLWTDALIGDTYQLTPAEFGAYMRLLIVAWRRPDCNLPNNDVFLGRCIGDRKNWHRLKTVVMAFWTLGEDGFYRQFRLLREREYVSRQAVKSSAGGKAKALKDRQRRSARGLPNDMPNECQIDAPTPTPTPKKESKIEASHKKNGRGRTTPLPVEWHVPKRATEIARELSVDVRATEGQFRDYLKSSGKQYIDYDAAFCNFVRNVPNFSKGNRPTSDQERRAQRTRETGIV